MWSTEALRDIAVVDVRGGAPVVRPTNAKLVLWLVGPLDDVESAAQSADLRYVYPGG